jgi:hypothetical protein
VVGGELRSRKGLNLPDIQLGISAFTEHDRRCLEFALAQGVDAVSQSFVESGEDIDAVRQAAQALGHQPFIIAKIERRNALNHLDDILEAADGIMIARGDLGTIQKHLKSLEAKAPGLLSTYQELGRQTVPIALAKGRIDEQRAKELYQLLNQS